MRIRSTLAAALGLPALTAGALAGVDWWAGQDLAGVPAVVVADLQDPVVAPDPAPAPAPAPDPAPAPSAEPTTGWWWDGAHGWSGSWTSRWSEWDG